MNWVLNFKLRPKWRIVILLPMWVGSSRASGKFAVT